MPPHAGVLQWEHLPFPKSLRDFQRLFPTDTACAAYLEGARWPKGFACPYCHEKGEPFRFVAKPGVIQVDGRWVPIDAYKVVKVSP